MRRSLYIALLVIFIDYLGLGLVYPLFSCMLFDATFPLLPPEASDSLRGFCLGLLFALMPIAQFFSAPLWGTLSDRKGRRPPLLWSLLLTFTGYLVALFGVSSASLFLILTSRLLLGGAAGNAAIVQAAIADVSTPEDKTKNFGLYSMVMGAGFTLGPLFGGFLAHWGYSAPFLFAACIVAGNLWIAYQMFRETMAPTTARSVRRLSWAMALLEVKKAFKMRGVRTILLTSFIYCFGWTFFFEFIPVYLLARFQFNSKELGLFFGVAGFVYALSSGVLIRPWVRWFRSELLFFFGMLLTAGSVLALPLADGMGWLWLFLCLLCFFTSFPMPTSTTLVSNAVKPEIQGEALGILSAVNAAAFGISPLFSGALVGKYPTLPMWIGGGTMLLGALIILTVFRSRLFLPKI